MYMLNVRTQVFLIADNGQILSLKAILNLHHQYDYLTTHNLLMSQAIKVMYTGEKFRDLLDFS